MLVQMGHFKKAWQVRGGEPRVCAAAALWVGSVSSSTLTGAGVGAFECQNFSNAVVTRMFQIMPDIKLSYLNKTYSSIKIGFI